MSTDTTFNFNNVLNFEMNINITHELIIMLMHALEVLFNEPWCCIFLLAI